VSTVEGKFGDYKVRSSYTIAYKFVAWCARTPKLGYGPLDVDEDVFFAFGETAEFALAGLKSDVAKYEARPKNWLKNWLLVRIAKLRSWWSK
jgi:hypothetical protein